MLTITRREGESFVIGKNGEIKVTILNIKENRALVGIEAPQDVPIYREEVYLKVLEEKAEK
jgi:carbon storage regulator